MNWLLLDGILFRIASRVAVPFLTSLILNMAPVGWQLGVPVSQAIFPLCLLQSSVLGQANKIQMVLLQGVNTVCLLSLLHILCGFLWSGK
jgi:hypothetical protein